MAEELNISRSERKRLNVMQGKDMNEGVYPVKINPLSLESPYPKLCNDGDYVCTIPDGSLCVNDLDESYRSHLKNWHLDMKEAFLNGGRETRIKIIEWIKKEAPSVTVGCSGFVDANKLIAFLEGRE